MCYGSSYTDPSGEDHPRAVVMVNYKMIYRLKESYTVGTQVLISFDDNSCHILSHEQTKLCYSVYSGTNYYIRRIKDQSKSCPYLPTRQSTVSGYILSQNDFNKVFISHKDKILLELKEKLMYVSARITGKAIIVACI